jgi:hypothetical protein
MTFFKLPPFVQNGNRWIADSVATGGGRFKMLVKLFLNYAQLPVAEPSKGDEYLEIWFDSPAKKKMQRLSHQ